MIWTLDSLKGKEKQCMMSSKSPFTKDLGFANKKEHLTPTKGQTQIRNEMVSVDEESKVMLNG